jgi:hypothetical protein
MTGDTLENVQNSEVLAATFNSQLAIGAGMLAVCVVIHGIGLFTLQRAMHTERMDERLRSLTPISLRGALFTLMIVFSLITLHFFEIWLFAFLYDMIGALHSFPEALYFSTISYATIGYSDASIHEQWRMVAALEGLLGVILLGWSTAFLIRVMGRLDGRGEMNARDTGASAPPPPDTR